MKRYRPLSDRFDELDRFDTQAVRQLHNVDEADVAFPALYTSHIIPVQVSELCQLLLR